MSALPRHPLALVFDLGGTQFRAALIDATGAIEAEAALPSPPAEDMGEASEIDPELWWHALLELASRLHRRLPAAFGAVSGLAICGLTRTQVFLDAAGEVIRPAMTWRDTRTAALVPELLATLPAEHPERGLINAFHPLARLAWLKRHEPARAARLASVLDPKDWLNFRLTGRVASDPVSLARLAASTGTTNRASLLAALDFADAVLPPLIEPQAIVAPVQPGLPPPFDRLAGVPVISGSNDTFAAVIGLGAMRPGVAYNISGTTEVFGLLGAEPRAAEGLLTVDWRGLWQLGGPGQNGADTFAWLAGLLAGEGRSLPDGGITALLAGPRDPQPLLFLPYLSGERVPHWDGELRGAFIGLKRSHTATDLAFAVLEGVAFLNRVVLERAETAMGMRAAEIRFGGGAARNPVWAQIKADILERDVIVTAHDEPGLVGAAALAFTGLGVFPTLAEAQTTMVQAAHRYQPDAAKAERYHALHALFRESSAAVAPVSRALARLGRSG
jgi:xylulokinase